ncbi:uncharacterized protein LOC141848985 isoform X2 [Brevipalpus obovatus]|uniref:uncharacterized protein LOC141848985 isoform X2 n=1 Tax=Brevipalpus obovatus TaxID=246614 RepID=UPI003D9EB7CD
MAVGLYIITIAISLVYAGSYHFVLGENGSSTYNFGYDTNHESSDADGNNKQDHGPRLMREETRLADGTVVGRYGYTDPFGVFRQVEYVAGPNGYYAYEDVGGGGGSTTLPLFFKATARQREQLAAQGARKMPGLAVLSDKFNPPLYHPEAHLADDPPVASVSVSTSSSSLDRSVDYNRLNGKPQRIPSNRNPSDRIVSAAPSSSSSTSQSRFSSGGSSPSTIVNASHDQRPKDGNRLAEYRHHRPPNERIVNPSSSPKTAFQFDYDQHTLRRRAGTLSNDHNNKDDVNSDEPVYLPEGGNDTEDLKELESYRVPTNVNVHRTSDNSKFFPSGHDDDVSESEYERSSSYPSSRTSSSLGRSLAPEAPVYRPVFSDESEEEIRPIFNRQDVPEPSNSDSPKKVRQSSAYSSSSSRRSIDSNGGGHNVGDNSRSSGSNANVDPSGDSGIRILGSSLSSSTRIVINDTLDEIQAARLREATIPEVEILSTYGKRLSPRIDDYAESFIQYGPRVPPTFISDDIKDSNFDQIEREDDPIKLEKSIGENPNLHDNNATNDVAKPEIVRKQFGLEENFKVRAPTTTSVSPRRDYPGENVKEPKFWDRIPTTTESSSRTQRFREATTTIAPADLSLDVTTVTTASERIVKHPLDRASSSPTIDIVRDEVIDSRGELLTSEPLYQIETTTKFADIFSSPNKKAPKLNGFGLETEPLTTTYAPSFDLDRSEESYDVSTATSPTKPINSPKEDEFLRIINERFFGRQSSEGPKTTVPKSLPSSPSPSSTTTTTTTTQMPVVTSKSTDDLSSGLISEQTKPRQLQNGAPKNFSDGFIAKPLASKEIYPNNDALDHYQHDSIEQEDWLHDIMKKKSLNNSLHRIETDVETPLDPNKPKKRIIKLFYKKGKLLQGQPGNLSNGDIRASASGPAKVFRMRTVKLSQGSSEPIPSTVQLPQEDRQHSKRHYKTEPVTPKPHEKFVENINRTQPLEIITTTTQASTTIKVTTLPPTPSTPQSLPVSSSRAPPPSSSFQNLSPKARRPVLRGSIGTANRSATVIKKRKVVLAPKPDGSLKKSEQNLTKIENLELSRKNEASLTSSISRSPLYVPPIMGLMDTRVGDEERKNQPLVGKLTSELVSSDVTISRSGLLHGSDSRISSLYVPPIPAGIVRGHRSAESSGSAFSNIFSIIAGSSSPLSTSAGSGSTDSGHGRTSNSYLNPVNFWKR